ncbi:hypothetical protein ACU47E_005605, partial [Escherichia coli]
RVNVKLTRGLSTSGLQVLPPAISRKAPTHNVIALKIIRNFSFDPEKYINAHSAKSGFHYAPDKIT